MAERRGRVGSSARGALGSSARRPPRRCSWSRSTGRRPASAAFWFIRTVPAGTLVGRLEWPALLGTVALAVALPLVARRFWRVGLRHYAGASARGGLPRASRCHVRHRGTFPGEV